MPVHDWTRVTPGIFHHFHSAWVVELARVLNSGLLPPDYYALAEQVAGRIAPDVIALELAPRRARGSPEARDASPDSARSREERGASTEARPSPRTSIVAKTENLTYATLRRTVVIRYTEDHEVVALIEILSHANKGSRSELELFLRKAQSALKQKIHLLLVDLYPPGRLDPHGVHGALWSALGQAAFEIPPDRLLAAAAYEAGEEITAYVEPFAVGDALPPMPLFLDVGSYVEVPLEATYEVAFANVPRYWKDTLIRG